MQVVQKFFLSSNENEKVLKELKNFTGWHPNLCNLKVKAYQIGSAISG